jgi:adenylate kinase family enzyme
MKILIFGGSGSGTTTVGKALAETLDFIHLDVDDYYWEQTTPAFQVKVSSMQRNAALLRDFRNHKNVIVSGSLVSWGAYWETAFDLAVFIYLPMEIRMKRLDKREIERYGDLLFTVEATRENSKAFLDWAQRYDDENFKGRSKHIHEEWMKLLSCPVLKLMGELELKEQVDKILFAMPHSSATK